MARGLLSRALERHDLPPGVLPATPESGRVRFEAGEPYHLGITLAGEAADLAQALLAGLDRLGRQRPSGPAPPTLAGNFRLEAADELPPPDLGAETAALSGAPAVTLQLLSPLRLERPEPAKQPSGGFLDDRCFPPEHFLTRLWARLFHLRHGRWPHREDEPPPLTEGITADPSGLHWLDAPVPGSPKKRRPYTLGGVVGRVRLASLPPEWLPWLVLGRHLHAGASTAYGLGRYRIEETAAAHPEPFLPATTALQRAARRERLAEALDHVVESSEAAGDDGIDPRRFAAQADRRLGDLSRELAAGSLRPSPLAGVLLPKPDGGLRALAIPTVRDRVAQRAVAQELAPAVDTLLEDCSFAYRKGLSRAGAARALEAAYAEGYRWVLDADIRSFFDAVPWPRLTAKLEALLPLDPVTALLAAWLRAPVTFDGHTIERHQGLPQGSPIAPLLANLYLDELDEDLQAQGFRLVRYADDFVVLAKDLEEARRAHEETRKALAQLGLALNEDDTAVRSFEGGFSYLGYLFVRSLVIEKERQQESGAAPAEELTPDDVPAASWLAAVPFQRLRQLVAGGEREGRPRGIRAVPRASGTDPSDPPRAPLYVTSPTARLHLDNGTLRVSSADSAEDLQVPLRSLSHLVFCGRVGATAPLLASLAREDVPSFFCHRSGELYAELAPHSAEWSLWLDQARLADDDAVRLAFAREVVAAKLANQARLAVRFGWSDAADVARDLRALAGAASEAETVEVVLGLEGRGAAVYFACLAASLPPEWGFAGRARRPAPDPVNAMLGFGYTLLYNHVSTALTAAGLNPRVGLLHRPRGRHAALASDLVEEMRWLVDALVWSLVNRRQVKPNEFRPGPQGGCWMSDDCRRRFVAAFEGRLHGDFTPPGGEEPTTYRAQLARQAQQVVRMARGEAAGYQALRLER